MTKYAMCTDRITYMHACAYTSMTIPEEHEHENPCRLPLIYHAPAGSGISATTLKRSDVKQNILQPYWKSEKDQFSQSSLQSCYLLVIYMPNLQVS